MENAKSIMIFKLEHLEQGFKFLGAENRRFAVQTLSMSEH